jgi:hypothetical protein
MSDKVQQFQDTLFRSHYKGTISIPFCAIDVAKELKIQ